MKRISCNYRQLKGWIKYAGAFGLFATAIISLMIVPMLSEDIEAKEEGMDSDFESLPEEERMQVIGAVFGLIAVGCIIFILMRVKDNDMP